MTTASLEVGSVADFPDDSMHPFQIGGKPVLLVRQKDEFYALEDRCTHDNGILHDGELLAGAVKCERHGAKFNLKNGRPTMPAVKKVRLYQTRIDDGKVFIDYQES